MIGCLRGILSSTTSGSVLIKAIGPHQWFTGSSGVAGIVPRPDSVEAFGTPFSGSSYARRHFFAVNDGDNTVIALSSEATNLSASRGISRASNGSRYMALNANSSSLRTSTNGTSWTTSSTPAAGALRFIISHSTASFLAVGLSGSIVNWNGSAWSAVSSGTTNQLNCVCNVSGATFVVVGNAGTVLRSTGGAYSAANAGVNTADNLTYVASDGSIAVATTGTASIYYSNLTQDSWTKVTAVLGAGNTLNAVEYFNGRFVAVGDCVAHSDDGGVTWIKQHTPLRTSGFTHLVKAGGYLFAYTPFSGSQLAIIYTADGIEWRALSLSRIYTNVNWSPILGKYVVCGNGHLVAAINDNGGLETLSTITITTAAGGAISDVLRSVVGVGDRHIILPQSGPLVSTTNFLSYLSLSSTTGGNTANGSALISDGQTVFYYRTGTSAYRTIDGISWDSFNPNISANTLAEVSYIRELGIFIASTTAGTFHSSVDGINWTQRGDTGTSAQGRTRVNYLDIGGLKCLVAWKPINTNTDTSFPVYSTDIGSTWNDTGWVASAPSPLNTLFQGTPDKVWNIQTGSQGQEAGATVKISEASSVSSWDATGQSISAPGGRALSPNMQFQRTVEADIGLQFVVGYMSSLYMVQKSV